MPPFYAWYIDPTYPYLLNGLSLTQGLPPGHTDHPGTSLQILVALVIVASHLVLDGSGEVVSSVIRFPETYLEITGVVQALLFVASYSISSYRILRSFGYFIGFIFSISVLAAVNLWLPWVVVATPESLVVSMSLLLVAIFAPVLRRPNADISLFLSTVAGVVLAIAITAKVIALPLALLAFVLLGPRRSLPVLAAAAATAVAILIPVMNQFPRMIDWYTSVGTGTARYGQDATTSITENLRAAVRIVTFEYPFIWLALMASGIAFIVLATSPQRDRIGSTPFRAVTAVLTAVLATTAFGIKVSHERDFITLTALVPALIVTSWNLISQSRWPSQLSEEQPRRSPWTLVALALAPMIVASVLVGLALQGMTQTASSASQRLKDYETLPSTSLARGVTFDVPDPVYALYFGDGWTQGDAFLADIGSAYSGALDFDPWARTLTGTDPSGLAGSLTCNDLRNLLRDRGVVLLMPEASLSVADPDATGAIALNQGFQIYYEPDQNLVTSGGFIQVTPLACSQ